MAKKILITGGSGFIGSHLVDLLLKQKYKITVLDLVKPKKKNIIFIKGTALNYQLIKKITKNVDYVFHLSGVSDINKVKKIPALTIENNILSSTYLLDACRINSVKRIFFASSIYAHGDSGNLYTTSKIATEKIIENYNLLFGLKYTILRYATAYGENNRGVDVVSIFTKKALTNSNIYIYGNGKQTRDFIHAKDIAAGSVKSIDKKYENKVLTVGTNRRTSISKLANIILNITNSGSKIFIRKKAKRFDDFDLDKIKKIKNNEFLKLKTFMRLEDGIKYYLVKQIKKRKK